MLPYANIFWFPTIASLVLLCLLWNELLGRSPTLFASWFLAALALQYFANGGWLWLIGLISQTALAIVLSLKRRMMLQ
ncbi:MAG: hypothetical protein HY047_07465 [Acidobacteria bacterium]|nr:hypothetical protein [Acidobacteriota bacterium]